MTNLFFYVQNILLEYLRRDLPFLFVFIFYCCQTAPKMDQHDEILFQLQFGQLSLTADEQIFSFSQSSSLGSYILQAGFDNLDLNVEQELDNDSPSHASHESFAALRSTLRTNLRSDFPDTHEYESDSSYAAIRFSNPRSLETTISSMPPPVPFYRAFGRATARSELEI